MLGHPTTGIVRTIYYIGSHVVLEIVVVTMDT